MSQNYEPLPKLKRENYLRRLAPQCRSIKIQPTASMLMKLDSHTFSAYWYPKTQRLDVAYLRWLAHRYRWMRQLLGSLAKSTIAPPAWQRQCCNRWPEFVGTNVVIPWLTFPRLCCTNRWPDLTSTHCVSFQAWPNSVRFQSNTCWTMNSLCCLHLHSFQTAETSKG